MSLPSEIAFASFLVYSPRGTTDLDRRSRGVRTAVKEDKDGVLALAARRLQEGWDQLTIKEFLGRDVLLVPAPRSAPLSSPGALWPGRRICEELAAAGLGLEVLPCLERHTAVPKAAFAAPGERTKALGHFETMRVRRELIVPEHRAILVVDDIVTSGSMLLASVAHVQAAFPGSRVLAFGLVRTVETVEAMIAPCEGRITLEASGLTRRRP